MNRSFIWLSFVFSTFLWAAAALPQTVSDASGNISAPAPKAPNSQGAAEPCLSSIDDRSSERCSGWAAVDAARSATSVAERSLDVAIAGTVGLFIALLFNWHANRLHRQTLRFANPPHIRITNARIQRADGVGAINEAFRHSLALTGSVWAVNVGRERADISSRKLGFLSRWLNKDEKWSSQCIAYWSDNPLPMARPFEQKRDGHNQLPKNKLAPGEYVQWDFSTQSEPGKNLYVMGFITYWGSQGNRRETIFCRRFCTTELRFVPVPNNPDYEAEE